VEGGGGAHTAAGRASEPVWPTSRQTVGAGTTAHTRPLTPPGEQMNTH